MRTDTAVLKDSHNQKRVYGLNSQSKNRPKSGQIIWNVRVTGQQTENLLFLPPRYKNLSTNPGYKILSRICLIH